jgi:hypothetical protein
MSQDPLSDVLSSVRLRGAIYYHVSCGHTWAAETPAGPALARAIMPGTEHVLAYHLIAKGSGWASVAGGAPVRLEAGDIVMFPRGDPHLLSSAPGLHALPDDSNWQLTTRDDPKPIAVAFHRGVLRPGELAPTEEAQTVIVCGFIGCDLRPFNPLIAALPRLLHLSASTLGGWVVPVLEQAVAESRERRAGSDAVLGRVSEMVFVDAARRHLESLPEDAAGWPCATAMWAAPSACCMRDRPTAGRSRNSAARSACRARRCTSVSSSASGSRRCSTSPSGACSAVLACCARPAPPWRRSRRTSAMTPRRRSRARSSERWGCRLRPGVARSPESRSRDHGTCAEAQQ